MTQRPIDLLPESVRARSQAGTVAGRYVAALLIGVVLLGLTATHSHLMLDLSRQRLEVAKEQADIVLDAEAKAAQMRRKLTETREYIGRYELIALPLEISRVLATVINELPSSATLDRIDLFAGTRRRGRGTRSRGVIASDEIPPRVMTGELSGFAATDQDVADLVSDLEQLGLFSDVSLDFSRTRTVRNVNAREFRVSFRADLEARFDVHDVPESMTAEARVP